MTNAIPADQIVSVNPSVLNAGGNARDLIGLCLTQNARTPFGAILPFPSADGAGAFFGLNSLEYAIANTYFQGFTGATATPGSLLFARYPETAIGAWIRSGVVSGLSLPALQALTGSLTITVDGNVLTDANISLAAANSFSAAAVLIQTAINSALPNGAAAIAMTYDSVNGAFRITSGTTGAASTIGYATGSIAASLGLTPGKGAALSQGADATDPASFMSGITRQTKNWASFFTANESSKSDAIAFAGWTTNQTNRYWHINWSTDIVNETAGSVDTVAFAIGTQGSNSNGTTPLYAPINGALTAAGASGYAAALNFDETNGRATMKFRNIPGLSADVTDGTVAANCDANGVSFYGAFATANEIDTFFADGAITGPYAWVDSYLNQIWLNSQAQLAVFKGMQMVKSIPFNAQGYALIVAWLTDPVLQALNFGAINTGVNMSASQIAAINSSTAPLRITAQLTYSGYYINVGQATPQVRAARGSPPVTLYYLDGGSVQKVSISSVEVQ